MIDNLQGTSSTARENRGMTTPFWVPKSRSGGSTHQRKNSGKKKGPKGAPNTQRRERRGGSEKLKRKQFQTGWSPIKEGKHIKKTLREITNDSP